MVSLAAAKGCVTTLIEALLPLDRSLVSESLIAELGELRDRLDGEIERRPASGSAG